MTRQQKKTLKMALSYLVIVLIGCLLLFPIAWMISCAFKTNEEIFGSIALLPKSFSIQNFVDGWKSAGSYTYLTYFLNSFALVVPTTVLTIAHWWPTASPGLSFPSRSSCLRCFLRP